MKNNLKKERNKKQIDNRQQLAYSLNMKVIKTTVSTATTAKNPLQAFYEQSFTIELTGFEALALYKVSREVGGKGRLREVFSSGSDKAKNKGADENFETKLGEIEGIEESLILLDKETKTQDSVYFWGR